MKIFDRIKGLVINPKNEWITIQQEQQSSTELLKSYLIPLVLIPVIASFIGYGIVGHRAAFIGHVGSFTLGLRYAVMMLINMLIGVYLTAFVIDLLAPSFGAVKNFNNALRLVVYSYTPAMVASIFYIVPSLSFLVMLASLYGLYILYLGIKPMMQAPDDKVTTYFIVSVVVLIAVYIVVGTVISLLLIKSVLVAGGL